MVEALAAVLVVTLAAAGTSVLVRWGGTVLGSTDRTTWSQATPYLGGLEPGTHAWNRFHVRYYALTLLFIAFEMEMMFMYPWAVVYVQEGVTALAEMGMFLGILSLGVLYGWREGAFRWQ